MSVIGRHIQRVGRAGKALSKPMGDNPAQGHCLQLTCLQLQFVPSYMAYSSAPRMKEQFAAKHWYHSIKLHGITF